MRYKEKQTRSILNVHKFIDSWFCDRYSVSAYQGCEFNCIYCFARSQEYAEHFGSEDTIYVKTGAARMLLSTAWTGTFWAGQNIQNLRESLIDVARRGDLGRIRNVTPEIEESVLGNLEEFV